MFYVCPVRFDVTGNLENFLVETKALFSSEKFWEMDTVAFCLYLTNIVQSWTN